ncbi:PAS domain-containing sensor histidine kinase [Martelella alba]|nr:ATP-binding protein [Martelella alba]
MMQRLEWTLAQQQASRHARLFATSTVLVAAVIFTVDTFTDIEGAIAVLYAIALLLASQAVSRTGLIRFAVIFLVLSLVSFFLTHASDPSLQTFLRLGVALVALGLTTTLLLRNDRARSALLETNAALRLSEGRYRSIFERTRVALWERDYSKLRSYLMDLKARGFGDVRTVARQDPQFVDRCIGMIKIVAANEAAIDLLGSSATRASNATMRDFIPLNSETFVSLLQAIMNGASYFEDNAEVLNDAGEPKIVLLSISFPEEQVTYDRVIVSMVDITQREQARHALAKAQEELARASRAATVGALSASLAHELNQPLGAIAVNSQTLLRWLDRDPPDMEAARRSAERIARDSQRTSNILRNTRSMLFSQPGETQALDLTRLIDDTLTLMKYDLQREAITVEFTHDTAIPVISSGRLEIQQVLINLISNAIQAIKAASPDRRALAISLHADAGRDTISITLHDTGHGLSADALQNLFTPFFTTRQDGMGIGLSICRSTIEARGGTITGHNHPDGGALFEITLPKETASA